MVHASHTTFNSRRPALFFSIFPLIFQSEVERRRRGTASLSSLPPLKNTMLIRALNVCRKWRSAPLCLRGIGSSASRPSPLASAVVKRRPDANENSITNDPMIYVQLFQIMLFVNMPIVVVEKQWPLVVCHYTFMYWSMRRTIRDVIEWLIPLRIVYAVINRVWKCDCAAAAALRLTKCF